MKNSILISSLILFALVFSSYKPSDKVSERAPKIDLKLNLKKGQVLNIKTDINQVITQSMMGMENVINQDIGMYYDMKVDDIVDGNYDMTVTYTRATFSTNNPMGSVEFDSETDKEDLAPMALGYAAVVDKSFKVRLSPKGRVLEVKDMDKFLAETIETINELNPDLGPQIAEGMKQQFGEKALKNSVENMVIHYPEKPVKVGATWDHSYSVQQGQGFEMFIENIYTLDRVEDGKAHLSVKANVYTSKDATMEMQGMTMIYKLTGEQTGSFVLDKSTNWVLESSLEQQVEGDMNISGGQIPEPMDIPMGIKTTTSNVWVK